ncbi:hypothetical protein [Wolbachia endosymbiont of Cruorifilaria tuberocauda]|uniref:hypothetical protein n=1 Tax=Wolbachia endosymbiont of Cruorifilaria tuberocauda TaxID=1812111 RepID=UPI001FE987B4|nr:hypothetical protein [Wolbachia endosymbiont of Cruorifilaria tuberocauda]
MASSTTASRISRGKSGFGLGHSDSIATIMDGIKWLFSFHEGAISSYSNVFEGLVSGSSLVTLLGKQGNMFGIKCLEGLAEYFSHEDRSCDDMASEGIDMSCSDKNLHLDDYPNFNNEIAHNIDGLHDIHDLGNHYDSFFSPSHSPHVSNDYVHEL